MATLYYDNATEDGNWATLGNWRLDNFTGTRVPATGLPTSIDNVVMTGAVTSNTGSEPTVASLTVESASLGIGITVTGVATFNSYSAFTGNATLTGNAAFNDSWTEFSNIVDGNATFDGFGGNYDTATVTGNATFTGGARNLGTVGGDAAFSDGSSNEGGTVSGDATFTDSDNSGFVGGDAEFFNGSNAAGFGIGIGVVQGNAVFRATPGSYDHYNHYNATVNGNAEFYNNTYNYGTVDGNATFNDYSFNNEYVAGDATFNNFSRISGGMISGTATFNDYSYVEYPINGSIVLDNSSYLTDDAIGMSANVEFRGNSYNPNGIGGTLVAAHGGGINGSSILGAI
jgi:hypothetical protein